jgi:uncharacterized caspase-like protein
LWRASARACSHRRRGSRSWSATPITSSSAGKDAQLIAEKLRQLSFDVTEKLDRNLKGMADDVDEFARKIRERGKDMVSVLYYAGHGLERDGINYLVPVDADIKRRSDVAARSLSVQRIADRLASAGNQLKNPDSRRLR